MPWWSGLYCEGLYLDIGPNTFWRRPTKYFTPFIFIFDSGGSLSSLSCHDHVHIVRVQIVDVIVVIVVVVIVVVVGVYSIESIDS